MAIQIVMNRTGDSRHPFNPGEAHELAEAEQRFYELTNAGFTAASLSLGMMSPSRWKP